MIREHLMFFIIYFSPQSKLVPFTLMHSPYLLLVLCSDDQFQFPKRIFREKKKKQQRKLLQDNKKKKKARIIIQESIGNLLMSLPKSAIFSS